MIPPVSKLIDKRQIARVIEENVKEMCDGAYWLAISPDNALLLPTQAGSCGLNGVSQRQFDCADSEYMRYPIRSNTRLSSSNRFQQNGRPACRGSSTDNSQYLVRLLNNLRSAYCLSRENFERCQASHP